ncbi:MAG: hypothetical protein KF834_08670 [Burkholderiales bacterium]|nr:hypothetical protein [Burkholderiales bacterium]
MKTPTFFCTFPVALAMVSCLFFNPAAAAELAGDDVLALIKTPWKNVTRELVRTRLDALLDRLDMDRQKLARFEYVRSARLAEAGELVEINEITDTILIARKGVKIGYSRNTVIIADGPVDIAHASGALIVAAGPIRISHENDYLWGNTLSAGGLYVTKENIRISFARTATFYAVKGAEISHGGPLTVYNTDITHSVSTINRFRRNPIFRNEPPR